MTGAPHDLLIETRGRLGILTLNRARAANALSFGMLQGLTTALAEMADSAAIDAVLIRSEGRSFCSGGDLVEILAQPAGPPFERRRRAYFATEYALNYQIHTFAKPYIAVIDGLTMGGGCGVSLHGSHIIATERTLLSMPETMIGHFPDAGATWFLNRLPGEMGVYVGLRGLRLSAADVVGFGLATHFVPSSSLAGLIDALAAAPRLTGQDVDGALSRFAGQVQASPTAARQARVDELFSAPTVEGIIAVLQTAKESWAEAALGVLQHASPLSLKVTLRMLREGRGLAIGDALRREYRICVRITGGHDLREGVRAVLIDKDDAPRWQPDRLELIDDRMIDEVFEPLAPEESELELETLPRRVH
jgi:enoyl-CoA hydratase